jgi:hypothetical protein
VTWSPVMARPRQDRVCYLRRISRLVPLQSKPQTNAVAAASPATKAPGTKTKVVCFESVQLGVKDPKPWWPCRSPMTSCPKLEYPFPPKPGKHEYVTATVAPGPKGLAVSLPELAIETVVVILAFPALGLAATAATANEPAAMATTAMTIVAIRTDLPSIYPFPSALFEPIHEPDPNVSRHRKVRLKPCQSLDKLGQ